MESIKILFSFSFPNITNKNLPFSVVLSKETDVFFSSHAIRFIRRENRYEVVWFLKNNKNIDRSFHSLFSDVVFSFDVFFEDVNIFNSFDLEVGKVYLLTNNNNDLLHKGTFLSSAESITPPEYIHHLLAKISIDMNKILLNPSNNNYRIELKKNRFPFSENRKIKMLIIFLVLLFLLLRM